jgi:hypothetical protein
MLKFLDQSDKFNVQSSPEWAVLRIIRDAISRDLGVCQESKHLQCHSSITLVLTYCCSRPIK